MINALNGGLPPVRKPRPGSATRTVALIGCKRFGPVGLRVKAFP